MNASRRHQLRETLSRICRLLMEARREELSAGPVFGEDDSQTGEDLPDTGESLEDASEAHDASDESDNDDARPAAD